jgi:hypothetical protein
MLARGGDTPREPPGLTTTLKFPPQPLHDVKNLDDPVPIDHGRVQETFAANDAIDNSMRCPGSAT